MTVAQIVAAAQFSACLQHWYLAAAVAGAVLLAAAVIEVLREETET